MPGINKDEEWVEVALAKSVLAGFPRSLPLFQAREDRA